MVASERTPAHNVIKVKSQSPTGLCKMPTARFRGRYLGTTKARIGRDTFGLALALEARIERA